LHVILHLENLGGVAVKKHHVAVLGMQLLLLLARHVVTQHIKTVQEYNRTLFG